MFSLRSIVNRFSLSSCSAFVSTRVVSEATPPLTRFIHRHPVALLPYVTPSNINRDFTRKIDQDRATMYLPDWRVHGVASVKNQSITDKCASFAIGTVMELLLYHKMHKKYEISVQDLINGAKSYSGFGICKFVMENGCIEEKECPWMEVFRQPEEKYTWKRADDVKVIKVVTRVDAYSWNNEYELFQTLKQTPIVIGMRIGPNFREYKGGLYEGEPDGMADGRHGITIVGAAVTPEGIPYLICQNSWGEQWGENGYINIRLGSCLCNEDGGLLIAALTMTL